MASTTFSLHLSRSPMNPGSDKMRSIKSVHKHQEFAKENLSPKLWDELHEATVAAENIEGSTEAKQIKNCIDDLEDASIALAESLMNDVANNAVKNQKVSDLSS